MAGRQDLSWGDTPQGASCPPSTGPSHFCSLPSLFASASPCCAFSSPFLHSSVVLLFKLTAPYHGQNKGEVERWDFELETIGLTLLGLTEEMKVEEMGDFRPPRSTEAPAQTLAGGSPVTAAGMGGPPAPPILGFSSLFLRVASTVYPSHLSQGSPLQNSEPHQAPMSFRQPSLVGIKSLGRAGWLERG